MTVVTAELDPIRGRSLVFKANSPRRPSRFCERASATLRSWCGRSRGGKLPGAVLTYLALDELGAVGLRGRGPQLTEAEGVALFLFASYLLGHLVFLIGSWLDSSMTGRAATP